MQDIAAGWDCTAFEHNLIGVDAGDAAETHNVANATKLFHFAMTDETAVKARRCHRYIDPSDFVEMSPDV